MADRKCEICGALNRPLGNFAYDAEYSYDDYYKTDSVKVCPYKSSVIANFILAPSSMKNDSQN